MTFERAIKTVNSQWDYDEIAPSYDSKGRQYETFYIKNGCARKPTEDECLAIALACGMRYHEGYFFKGV